MRKSLRALSVLHSMLGHPVAVGHLSSLGFANADSYRSTLASDLRAAVEVLVARRKHFGVLFQRCPIAEGALIELARQYCSVGLESPHWEVFAEFLADSGFRFTEPTARCAFDALLIVMLLKLSDALSLALVHSDESTNIDNVQYWACQTRNILSWPAFRIAERLSPLHAIFCDSGGDGYLISDATTRFQYRLEAERRTRITGLEPRLAVTQAIEFFAGHACSSEGVQPSGHWRGWPRVRRSHPVAFAGSMRPVFLFLVSTSLLFTVYSLRPLGSILESDTLSIIAGICVFLLLYEWVDVAVRRLSEFPTIPRPIMRASQDFALRKCYRLAVAIPVVLRSTDQLRSVISSARSCCRLLGQTGLNIVILSDFPDAIDANLSDSERSILANIIDSWDEISCGGSPDDGDVILLHRDRCYVEREKTWMGTGRKAGKIHSFFEFVTDDGGSYSLTRGPAHRCKNFQYVAVVDEDTRFSADDILALYQIALHPANTAMVSDTGRVMAGYGIVAAGTNVAPHGFMAEYRHDRTSLRPFVRDPNFEGFGERFFAGKGLYDVHVAVRCGVGHAVAGRCLSHDVIEGAYLRTAHCPDVIFREDGAPSKLQELVRAERWVRGDLQNLMLLLPVRMRLSNMSLFGVTQVVASVRKQMIPVVQLALLVILMANHNVSTFIVIAVAVLPLLLEYVSFFIDALRRSVSGVILIHFMDRLQAFARTHRLALDAFALIPYRAVVILRAGSHVLRGMLGGPLLKWIPTSAIDRGSPVAAFHIWMLFFACLFGMTICYVVYWTRGSSIIILLPMIWTVGPAILITHIMRRRGEAS